MIDASARLAALGVTVEDGLADAELDLVEQTLGFEFADDHRAFLAAGLPVGAGWPNWRGGSRLLQKQLQLPLHGILYAVEWSEYWNEGWGPRPARVKDALRSANYHLARVPKLVPVHTHRYLPADRGSSGHPVLSVVRTDVTVVGADLADFIEAQIGSTAPPSPAVATAEFWSDLTK